MGWARPGWGCQQARPNHLNKVIHQSLRFSPVLSILGKGGGGSECCVRTFRALGVAGRFGDQAGQGRAAEGASPMQESNDKETKAAGSARVHTRLARTHTCKHTHAHVCTHGQ